MDRSQRITDAVRRLAEAASQISQAVRDVDDLAGEIAAEDLTPETRVQWEGFIAALSEALAAARSVLENLPKSN